MTKKKEVQLIGAAKMMEKVFTSGLYRQLKYYENRVEKIKDKFYQLLKNSEKNRHEFDGVVAKYRAVNIYETDHKGLLSHLDDYGLLPAVAKIDDKLFKKDPDAAKKLEPFAFPPRFYVRFYLNGKGNQHLDKTEYDFTSFLPELSHSFLSSKRSLEELQQELEREKERMLHCPLLKQAGSLKSNYGTVKLMKKKTKYDMYDIYQELGPEFILENGKVNMEQIDEFIARGFINSKDVSKYRKVIDRQLQFIVTDIESEQRAWESFQLKQNRRAQMARMA